MTDSPSSDRDELVAAYLDGEATPAERAIVEGDAELMERVAILSQVVSLVSEPVSSPPADVRRAHIAAALDASATAPNVTSMAAPRKRRFSTSQIAAAAAAVVALFAVPIALSQGGDDEDAATSSFESGDSVATGDGAAAAGDAVLTEAEEEPAEEPAMEEAEIAADDGAGDDGGEAFDAPAAEPVDEEVAEALETDDDAADEGQGGLPLQPRFDVEVATDVDDLVAQILPPPDGARQSTPDLALADELACVERIADTAAGDPVVVTGTGRLANDLVEYVVVDRLVGGQPTLELTVFDQTCTALVTQSIGG